MSQLYVGAISTNYLLAAIRWNQSAWISESLIPSNLVDFTYLGNKPEVNWRLEAHARAAGLIAWRRESFVLQRWRDQQLSPSFNGGKLLGQVKGPWRPPISSNRQQIPLHLISKTHPFSYPSLPLLFRFPRRQLMAVVALPFMWWQLKTKKAEDKGSRNELKKRDDFPHFLA